jgi:hypothetical protein
MRLNFGWSSCSKPEMTLAPEFMGRYSVVTKDGDKVIA